jgi:Zn-dependent peptidase ImmA (M78 family)
VILHECGHAIFDVESSIASLDFQGFGDRNDVIEERADAFAQECLLPIEVLRPLGSTSAVLNGNTLSRELLADLVAHTHCGNSDL